MSDQAGQRSFTSGTGRYNQFEFLFRTLLSGVATATLVEVTAVHPGSDLIQGTVDAQLLVNQQDSLGNTTPHGIIMGLPYARVQAGSNALILDPVVGDIGVAVFASRDISSVKANLAQSNPGSQRRYSYSDGIYLFSALSDTEPENYIQITDALIQCEAPSTNTSANLVAGTGASGSFTTPTGQVVTVQDGIITNIY